MIYRFDPNAQQNKAAERRECERVKQIVLNEIPENIKEQLIVELYSK